MKASMDLRDGKMTVFLKGELDHSSAQEIMRFIERRIECHLPRTLVLDMAGVSFMDSSGIAVILKADKRQKETGGRFWVENILPQPMKVLSAAKIERIVKISVLSE